MQNLQKMQNRNGSGFVFGHKTRKIDCRIATNMLAYMIRYVVASLEVSELEFFFQDPCKKCKIVE